MAKHHWAIYSPERRESQLADPFLNLLGITSNLSGASENKERLEKEEIPDFRPHLQLFEMGRLRKGGDNDRLRGPVHGDDAGEAGPIREKWNKGPPHLLGQV